MLSEFQLSLLWSKGLPGKAVGELDRVHECLSSRESALDRGQDQGQHPDPRQILRLESAPRTAPYADGGTKD